MPAAPRVLLSCSETQGDPEVQTPAPLQRRWVRIYQSSSDVFLCMGQAPCGRQCHLLGVHAPSTRRQQQQNPPCLAGNLSLFAKGYKSKLSNNFSQLRPTKTLNPSDTRLDSRSTAPTRIKHSTSAEHQAGRRSDSHSSSHK